MAGSDQRVAGWHHHRNRINESQAEKKKKSLIFFFIHFFPSSCFFFERSVAQRHQITNPCLCEWVWKTSFTTIFYCTSTGGEGGRWGGKIQSLDADIKDTSQPASWKCYSNMCRDLILPLANQSLMRLGDFKQGCDSAWIPQTRDELSVTDQPPSPTWQLLTHATWPSSSFIDKILRGRFSLTESSCSAAKCDCCQMSAHVIGYVSCLLCSEWFCSWKNFNNMYFKS